MYRIKSPKIIFFLQVQNKIVLSRLSHDIEELRWRVEESKLRLTGELKVATPGYSSFNDVETFSKMSIFF